MYCQVILGALHVGNLQPSNIETLEMHGTGTQLGDPIEIGAALTVLRSSSTVLRLTASKSRVGHAEAAAGGIGFIQVGFGAHKFWVL